MIEFEKTRDFEVLASTLNIPTDKLETRLSNRLLRLQSSVITQNHIGKEIAEIYSVSKRKKYESTAFCLYCVGKCTNDIEELFFKLKLKNVILTK